MPKRKKQRHQQNNKINQLKNNNQVIKVTKQNIAFSEVLGYSENFIKADLKKTIIVTFIIILLLLVIKFYLLS